MKRRKRDPEEPGSPEVEEALVDRLRQLEWPRPTEDVKQRCLADILERMDEAKQEAPKGARLQSRPRGAGERHSLTRRTASARAAATLPRRVASLGHRQPWSAPDRPARVATVLW